MLTKISKLIQGRGKLSNYCTSHYKMESIYTKFRMKDQGSCELVDEAMKEERKEARQLSILNKPDSRVLDGFMNDLGL